MPESIKHHVLSLSPYYIFPSAIVTAKLQNCLKAKGTSARYIHFGDAAKNTITDKNHPVHQR